MTFQVMILAKFPCPSGTANHEQDAHATAEQDFGTENGLRGGMTLQVMIRLRGFGID